MREIKFRPLRLDKRSGGVIVASYASWRAVKTAGYLDFRLLVWPTIDLREDEFVFNSRGEQLFFPNYGPGDIVSVVDPSGYYPHGRHRWMFAQYFTYSAEGLDCDGVPLFSYLDGRYVVSHYSGFADYIPLTVGMVNEWFNWFLDGLEKAEVVYW